MKRTAVGLGEVRFTLDPQERLCVYGLGSCAAVYLYAPGKSAYGLAHVVLPQSSGRNGEPGRYADTAVPTLIDGMLERGVEPSQLRAAIVGGAAVMALTFDIGKQNVSAVRSLLAQRRIPIVREHTGGTRGRSVEFDPERKEVDVRVLEDPQV